MKSMKSVLSVLILICSFSQFASAAMSASDKKMMMMHEKMGSMHMMAAKCMKSGKSMSDCNDMMMKECKMGDESCKKMMMMMEESMSKMSGEGMMDDTMMKKEK